MFREQIVPDVETVTEILAISVMAPREGIGNPNLFRNPMQSGRRYIHVLANITEVSHAREQLNLAVRSDALLPFSLFSSSKYPEKFVCLKYGTENRRV